MKSWRVRVETLSVAILILVITVLVWTSINYSRQMKATIYEENEEVLSLWISQTESQLDHLNGQINELLLTIYNNTELTPGSPVMKDAVKRKCVDAMSDKLTVTAQADCFFIYDAGSGNLLFSGSGNLSAKTTLGLKADIASRVSKTWVTMSDETWMLINAGQKNYFYRAVKMGKYVVGTATGLDHYDMESGYIVSGEEFSLDIMEDGEAIHLFGDTDRSEWIFTEENRQGRRSIKNSQEMKDHRLMLSALSNARFFGSITSQLLLILAAFVSVLLTVVLFIMISRSVVKPIKKLLQANRSLAAGDLDYQITDRPGSTEFAELFTSFNDMARETKALKIEAYDRIVRDRENQLRLLRAQIRPHFYLNAINTISNMTYDSRNDDIRKYCLALSSYMRYMLGVQSDFTGLRQELENIETYTEMQRIRFPDSVELKVLCDENVAGVQIPFLVAFTLVENSYKHALSGYECLNLFVSASFAEEEDFRGCLIVIEDDGPGFSEEALWRIENQPEADPVPKEHMGISNVRYTLALTYGRQDLLRISNREDFGARIELRIPTEPQFGAIPDRWRRNYEAFDL